MKTMQTNVKETNCTLLVWGGGGDAGLSLLVEMGNFNSWSPINKEGGKGVEKGEGRRPRARGARVVYS